MTKRGIMSKRFNIGIVTKSKHNKIKDLEPEKIIIKFGDVVENQVYLSKLSNEVFCLGKEFDESILLPYKTRFFSSKLSNELVNNEDSSLYLISKDGLLAIINQLRLTIAEELKNLLSESEDAKFSYIFFKLQEWNNTVGFFPYELDKEKISNSNHLEYFIFELVRIYKTINWDKELVCISRW